LSGVGSVVGKVVVGGGCGGWMSLGGRRAGLGWVLGVMFGSFRHLGGGLGWGGGWDGRLESGGDVSTALFYWFGKTAIKTHHINRHGRLLQRPLRWPGGVAT